MVGWVATGNTLLAGILLGFLHWKTLRLAVAADRPTKWTGGEYGPEGGLLLTLAKLAGIAWTARTPRLSRDPAVLALGPMIGTVDPGSPSRWDSDARRIESEGA